MENHDVIKLSRFSHILIYEYLQQQIYLIISSHNFSSVKLNEPYWTAPLSIFVGPDMYIRPKLGSLINVNGMLVANVIGPLAKL